MKGVPKQMPHSFPWCGSQLNFWACGVGGHGMSSGWGGMVEVHKGTRRERQCPLYARRTRMRGYACPATVRGRAQVLRQKWRR